MVDLDSYHYKFARLAVDSAKLCPVDPESKNAVPRVAIVIADGEQLIGWFAKGHGGEVWVDGEVRTISSVSSAHAEQALLEALKPRSLCNATAYVTLEPCTKKRGKGKCCADLIVDAGIKEVHVGNVDPNPDVGALAWKTFFANGVVVRDFPPDLRNEAARDNYSFFRKFHTSPYLEDGAGFDYRSNGGIRVLGPPGREFQTKWGERGRNSIYALDYDNNVAIAKNCTAFDQVDDPGRWFEDQDYFKAVNEGQIVVFRNAFGFALVRVGIVRLPTPSSNAELQFRYQLRYLEKTPG
jgi:diaminohydroxyphosphoribosylaminopyrimidine deaminase/5-amino-6-(5-phosphoribosylamino)uracil reductase